MRAVGPMFGTAALLLAGQGSAAAAQDAVFRCLVEGNKQDFRVSGGQWYERRPKETMEWTPLGCGDTMEVEGKTHRRTTCGEDAGELFAVTATSHGARAQILDPAGLRYSFYHSLKFEGETRPPPDMAGDCAVLEREDADPTGAWPLSKKLANGMPFVLATTREGIRLRPGDWKFPDRHSYFVHFDGRYHPLGGTWSVSAVGFDPHGINSYHSCPPYDQLPRNAPICGGIHQPGHVMDRWYRPEDKEFVAFGYAYQFDEQGIVYSGDRPVARIMVPDL